MLACHCILVLICCLNCHLLLDLMSLLFYNSCPLTWFYTCTYFKWRICNFTNLIFQWLNVALMCPILQLFLTLLKGYFNPLQVLADFVNFQMVKSCHLSPTAYDLMGQLEWVKSLTRFLFILQYTEHFYRLLCL